LGAAVVAALVVAAVLVVRNSRPTTTGADRAAVEHPTPEAPPDASPPPLPDPRVAVVQPSVERGVAFLKARVDTLSPANVRSDHPFLSNPVILPGVAGLVGLTLLECGAPPDDPSVERVAQIIRDHADTMDRVYVLCAALFFLNRWDESRPLKGTDRDLVQTFALRIIAGQLTSGVWGYEGRKLTPAQERDLLESLRTGTYAPGQPVRLYSISNTQFAMLALWGARNNKLAVRPCLLKAAEYFHKTQQADGHWVYSNVEPGCLWTCSTCAGLIALAIEKALREDSEFVGRTAAPSPAPGRADADRAFAYLGRSIGRKKGDPGGGVPQYKGTLFAADAWGDLYFLWSVDRVGMIYQMDEIAGKDWYEWGYPIVKDAQQADGSWKDRFDPVIDTCFALLFLRRANIARDLTRKLQQLGIQRGADQAPQKRREEAP
jgi:hypothetical protein